MFNMKQFSTMNYPRAAVKGHPTRAPRAVKNIATGILPRYQPPMDNIDVIMPKLLGRKAVDALNMPAANTRAPIVSRPVLAPNCRQTALKFS